LAVAYTLHPHPPFTLPKRDNYTAENSPRKEYYKALKYSDDTLKDFFTAAAREMWFKDTVFVLMADHAYEETQGRDAFHIPLLVYAPGIVTPRVDNRIVSELDVLPTLVDLLQISTFHASMGKSALAEGERVAYLDVEHAAGIVQHKDGFSQVALLGSDTLVGAYDLVNDAQWKTKLKDNLYTKEEIQQMLDYVGVMGYAIRENKIAERTPKSLF
ncbi:MAG TPA: sulfatase-like hydrolase/transferase, partial [Turneriella sp.]|nr:sulfatase-like hydrolase/transferase [Turneriella sp.]